MMNETPSNHSPQQTQSYRRFLNRVVSTGRLWAIWCGDRWATANDPKGRSDALFLLWKVRRDAEVALRSNSERFPIGSEVDAIELDKWVERYTPELAEANASVFICTDTDLNGLVVEPNDLKRDLVGLRLELQGSDIVSIRKRVKNRKRHGNTL